LLVFLAAVFFLLITPGPGVLSTAGVGASFGKEAAIRYVTGLFIGTNLVALAVVTGVAGLVLALPGTSCGVSRLKHSLYRTTITARHYEWDRFAGHQP